jgi:G:T-mismatch repair DNA endonuclease (very short patch repair protein)
MVRPLTPADLANYATRATEAKDFVESMREHLLAAIAEGVETDRKAAAFLNRRGFRTRMKQRWTAAAVTRLRLQLGIPRIRAVVNGKANDGAA